MSEHRKGGKLMGANWRLPYRNPRLPWRRVGRCEQSYAWPSSPRRLHAKWNRTTNKWWPCWRTRSHTCVCKCPSLWVIWDLSWPLSWLTFWRSLFADLHFWTHLPAPHTCTLCPRDSPPTLPFRSTNMPLFRCNGFSVSRQNSVSCGVAGVIFERRKTLKKCIWVLSRANFGVTDILWICVTTDILECNV